MGTPFVANEDDHCFHEERNDPMNPNNRIHEHCCTGRVINFKFCDDKTRQDVHDQTGDFTNGGTVVQFCEVFFCENSFKNDVNKIGLIRRWSIKCQFLSKLRVINVNKEIGQAKNMCTIFRN